MKRNSDYRKARMKINFNTEIERIDSFDVVVCGGGPSGIAAALQSSRAGLSVALIEENGCFGGTMTSAAVSHLLGGRRWDEKTRSMVREVGGIFDEITDSLIAKGKAVDPSTIDVDNNPYGWYPRMAAGIPCDSEALKRELDTLIQDSGITAALFTTVVAIQRDVQDDALIKYLIAHDQSGFRAFTAKTIIDATGDAQIAFLAGCPVRTGRDEDNLMTPATLIMHVDTVDMQRYVAYQNRHQQPKLIDIITRLKDEGVWNFPYEIFIAIQLNDEDVCMVNTVRQVGVDGTNAQSLTDAMIDGRRQCDELLQIMKRYFPGFEQARLRFTAPRIGIRETRRISGRSNVTLRDALDGRRYEDEVLKTTYNFDLPDPKRPSFDPMLGSVDNPNAKRTHVGIYAPYGVMLPQTVDNLIVCGRCVSVDREVLGPMRVTGPAMMGGQAAGFAAALAKQYEIHACAVDGREVRESLVQAGCIL